MEDIHGVDVSWLHKSHKDQGKLKTPDSKPTTREPSPAPPATQATSNSAATNKPLPKPAVEQAPPAEKPQPAAPAKSSTKRPGLLGRSVSDKSSSGGRGSEETKSGRRPSWMSSLSSKFSSEKTPSPAPAQSSNATKNESAGGLPSPPLTPTKSAGLPVSQKQQSERQTEAAEADSASSDTQQAKGGSFLSSALRRLSTSSTVTTTVGRVGGPVLNASPRCVLNIDKERERSKLKEFNQSKLRKVAFSVDVEIAGHSRLGSPPEDADDKKKKHKDKKLKEQAEGNALKHPEAVQEEKEKDEEDEMNVDEKAQAAAPAEEPSITNGDQPSAEADEAEEEHRARKEKRRKKAEAAGSIPREIDPEADDSITALPQGPAPPTTHDIPTTDPLRVYRRCCQLREAPVLKRISEQLANPVSGGAPGIIGTLDLRGSRLQLADMVVLSDWLAIVPVKVLLMEDANLSDEGLRVILAGLLAAGLPEPKKRKRGKSSPTRPRKKPERRHHGVVEKLTLKNNPKITREGWLHICLFIHMSRSLKALDVSLIPFPETKNTADSVNQTDLADLLYTAVSERLGGSDFEELIMGECRLKTYHVGKIVEAVMKIRLKRLGLAGNRLDEEGLRHAARFIKSGVCQGIDLGYNDLRNKLDIIAESLDPTNHIAALSFADCNLDPQSLVPLFPALVELPNFRFLDFSHNHDLFSTNPSALGTLRKYLPKLNMLRRLHLCDVSMSPAQAIGLSEVLPEARNLNHLNILENPPLTALSLVTDEAGQEEACALYASLMAAVRVSKSLLAIDIDVPGPDTSDVVKALAKQVVAYCLRNMERFTAAEAIKYFDSAAYIPDLKPEEGIVATPDVLLHLVGHSDGDSGPHDNDPPAPDDDYIVSGQGLVKALSYCLGQRDSDQRRLSTAPGVDEMASEEGRAKAKEMSKNLLGSARKIRIRLEPAIAQELKNGDEIAYRRLLFLDHTLKGMIERFEEEYPDTRIPVPEASAPCTPVEQGSGLFPVGAAHPAAVPPTVGAEPVHDGGEEYLDEDDEDGEPRPYMGPRRTSDVSLASRALGQEEGRMHRLGQRVRRDILRPQGLDHAHGTSADDPAEAEHLAALRAKLESIGGDEMRQQILSDGYDNTVKLFTEDVEQLAHLEENYPDEFRRFRNAQLAAQESMTPEQRAALEKRETGASP